MMKIVGPAAVLYGLTTGTTVDPVEGVLVEPRTLQIAALTARILELEGEGPRDLLDCAWMDLSPNPLPEKPHYGDLATKLEAILLACQP